MRLVTGDECGLLKEVIPELGRKKKDPKALIQPHSAMIDVTTTGMSQRVDPKEPQTRDRGVIDMVWMHQGEDFNSSFAVLRKNGSVDVWNSNCAETKQSFGDYSCLSDKTAVTTTATATATTPNNNSVFGTNNDSNSVGVGVGDNICRPLGLGYFREQNRLVAGDMFGNVVVLDAKNGNHCGIVQTYNSYTSSKGGTTISYTPGKMENMQLATAIGFDAHRGRVAVGGREREVCLTDLSTGKLVFKTKNTPPDPQTLLQQPVWPTAIRFLDEGSSSSPSPSNVMAVGTAYKQVRLYDVRESSGTRRPTSLTPEGLLEYRVTCLCQVGEHELVVGDAAGDIHTLDLRRLLVRNRNDSKGPAHAHNAHNAHAHANRDMARYAGPAGSVRQLQKHPTLPRLVAVGLDRMVRVYDTTTREQLDCVYLKQRLNCLLIHQYDNLGSPEDNNNNNNNGVVSDEEYYSDDGVDMDQDDVVRDYVDSDDDEDIDESDNNNNNNNEGEPAGSDSASANESMDDDDDDDENSEPQQEDESSDEDISGEEMSGDNSDESDEESGDDDNDDDDDEEEEEEEEEKTQQSKRRRRR
eukprot:jgi/Psemu1/57942/gm1.57942_g